MSIIDSCIYWEVTIMENDGVHAIEKKWDVLKI